MTEMDRFLVTILLLAAAFLVMIAVAAIVERAGERELQRKAPRPRIPADERELLGDDWRDHAGRWGR